MAERCHECGATMTVGEAPFRYDLGGLPNVTLVGVEVSRCPGCGEEEVTIPRPAPLHRTIAQALIAKRARLVPEEIRFLRKLLELSGAAFATHMGVAAETVSRWETGAAPIGAQADRLLRLMVAHAIQARGFSLEQLAAIDDAAEPAPLRLRLAFDGRLWLAETV